MKTILAGENQTNFEVPDGKQLLAVIEDDDQRTDLLWLDADIDVEEAEAEWRRHCDLVHMELPMAEWLKENRGAWILPRPFLSQIWEPEESASADQTSAVVA